LPKILSKQVLTPYRRLQIMPIPKYQRFINLMSEENKQLFDKFQPIHDSYQKEPAAWEKEFNSVGMEVVDVIRFWERKLCSGMERGQHAQFSNRLAEKFWAEIKKRFSMIDLVGVKSHVRLS
jgi:hypothetical protein